MLCLTDAIQQIISRLGNPVVEQRGRGLIQTCCVSSNLVYQIEATSQKIPWLLFVAKINSSKKAAQEEYHSSGKSFYTNFEMECRNCLSFNHKSFNEY